MSGSSMIQTFIQNLGTLIALFIVLFLLEGISLYISQKKITINIVCIAVVINFAITVVSGAVVSILQSDGPVDIQKPSGNTSTPFIPTTQREQPSIQREQPSKYGSTDDSSTNQLRQANLERSNTSHKSLTYISFSKYNFKKDLRFHVYSAPSKSSWYREVPDGGPPYTSTNGDVYVAGCDGDWILIKYETNNGLERMGYTLEAQGSFGSLSFDYYPGSITKNCSLSDGSDSVRLNKYTEITVLGRMSEGIYIETEVNGKRARGVVPESCVQW